MTATRARPFGGTRRRPAAVNDTVTRSCELACPAGSSLDRRTVREYLLGAVDEPAGGSCVPGSRASTRREVPRPGAQVAPVGVCLAGWSCRPPTRRVPGRRGPRALPPYAARAAQPLTLADIGKLVAPGSGHRPIGTLRARRHGRRRHHGRQGGVSASPL